MANETVKCPECGSEIPLTKILTSEIESSLRAKSEAHLKELEGKLRKKMEAEAEEREDALKKEKPAMEAKTRKEVSFANSVEIKDLKEELEKKTEDLKASQDLELDLRRQRRELEEREASLKLEVQRTLDRERAEIAEAAARKSEEAHSLKDLEKETKIAEMLAQIEILKRKAEQGSQQSQGETLELMLEEALRKEFPFDSIEPVAKGVKGADVLQTVNTRTGRECGAILWEMKRTKSFSASWIDKLKADCRAAKADVAMLVSEALPEGVQAFKEIEGVWVCSIQNCVPLAHALRTGLVQVAHSQALQTGKKDKAELVYEYVISTEFRGRLESVFEAFQGMKEDLDAEKRAYEKMFSKREKHITQVISQLAGMHGDFEAVAGSALPGIKMLELPKK
jgi:hypothetical protein